MPFLQCTFSLEWLPVHWQPPQQQITYQPTKRTETQTVRESRGQCPDEKIGNPKDSVGHGQGKPSLGHLQRSDWETLKFTVKSVDNSPQARGQTPKKLEVGHLGEWFWLVMDFVCLFFCKAATLLTLPKSWEHIRVVHSHGVTAKFFPFFLSIFSRVECLLKTESWGFKDKGVK